MESFKNAFLTYAVILFTTACMAQAPQGTVTIHQQTGTAVNGDPNWEATKMLMRDFSEVTGKIIVTQEQFHQFELNGKIQSAADRERYFVITTRENAARELSDALLQLQDTQSH